MKRFIGLLAGVALLGSGLLPAGVATAAATDPSVGSGVSVSCSRGTVRISATGIGRNGGTVDSVSIDVEPGTAYDVSVAGPSASTTITNASGLYTFTITIDGSPNDVVKSGSVNVYPYGCRTQIS